GRVHVTGIARAVGLGAVARRQDRGLGLARQGLAQGPQSGLELVDGVGEPAAHIERRGRVVEAQRPDGHSGIIKFASFSSTCAFASRMGPLDFTFHVLGFAAPALFVALAVTFAARFVGAASASLRWWSQAAINFTAGLVV